MQQEHPSLSELLWVSVHRLNLSFPKVSPSVTLHYPQGQVPESLASSGNLLETQNLRPCPNLLTQKLWAWGAVVLSQAFQVIPPHTDVWAPVLWSIIRPLRPASPSPFSQLFFPSSTLSPGKHGTSVSQHPAPWAISLLLHLLCCRFPASLLVSPPQV